MNMSEKNEELKPKTTDEPAPEKTTVAGAGFSSRIAVPDPTGIAVPDPTGIAVPDPS